MTRVTDWRRKTVHARTPADVSIVVHHVTLLRNPPRTERMGESHSKQRQDKTMYINIADLHQPANAVPLRYG